jgi:hypothetical protein
MRDRKSGSSTTANLPVKVSNPKSWEDFFALRQSLKTAARLLAKL